MDGSIHSWLSLHEELLAVGRLLAAAAGAPLYDENVEEHAAITEMAERVVSLGPLAGLGTYDIYNDYYDLDMNYKLVRNAIQTLNPSNL